ncbi:MAG: phosphoglycerate kinase [Patescibacteria group bacterium]|nr:phosphoglycerate kinase [Patescibacteria group bacterium]
MKDLPILNSRVQLKNKRVLLRLDWNIPVQGMPSKEDLAKVDASVSTVRYLQKHGAIVIILTHLGRPKKRDKSLSTVRLLPMAEAYLDCPVMFCGEDITKQDGKLEVESALSTAKSGDVFLMENVRFYEGEEKNDVALSQTYASLADYFVNDAFASSHRAHVSVAGIARYLPHFAGPELINEIEAASRLIEKPKRPFVTVIGGMKLSTKMPVINSLLKAADKVLIGGAMAHPFFVAKKYKIGKSYTEVEGLKFAKALIKNKKIVLPSDALVAKKIDIHAKPHVVLVNEIKLNDVIGDIGTATMREWSSIIKNAQTILWNGPLGVAKIPAFSHGSLVIARAIAARSNGAAYGLVGGGDTVPVALQTGMSEWYDHVSMGGGALLEFIEKKGRLPGIEALLASSTRTLNVLKASLKRPQEKKQIARKMIAAKSKKIVQKVKKIVHKKGSLKKKK